PQVSHADNGDRTTSTHALAQASPSFSPRQQSQSSHQSQNHYGHFSDSSYIDLPTLESLRHSEGNVGVGMGTGAYGQGIGVGIGVSRPGGNGAFGSASGLR